MGRVGIGISIGIGIEIEIGIDIDIDIGCWIPDAGFFRSRSRDTGDAAKRRGHVAWGVSPRSRTTLSNAP